MKEYISELIISAIVILTSLTLIWNIGIKFLVPFLLLCVILFLLIFFGLSKESSPVEKNANNDDNPKKIEVIGTLAIGVGVLIAILLILGKRGIKYLVIFICTSIVSFLLLYFSLSKTKGVAKGLKNVHENDKRNKLFGPILTVVITAGSMALVRAIGINTFSIFVLIAIILLSLIFIVSMEAETFRAYSARLELNNDSSAIATPCLSIIPPVEELISLIFADVDLFDVVTHFHYRRQVQILKGDGGTGKTALVKHLINREKRKIELMESRYNYIAWIEGNQDVKNAIFQLCSPFIQSGTSLKDLSISICKWLQTNSAFIVIDHLDHFLSKDEKDFLNTISGNTTVLITTRLKEKSFENYEVIFPDIARKLFIRTYYPQSFRLTPDSDNWDDITNILKETDKNLLFVELLAKAGFREQIDLKELLELAKRINRGFLDDERYFSITNPLRNLYDLGNVNKKQRGILLFMSLFPANICLFYDLFKWAGFSIGDLEDLFYYGWIDRNGKGYLLHSIVKASIVQQYGDYHCSLDDILDCRGLIRGLSDTSQYMSFSSGYKNIEEMICIPETICSLIEVKRIHYSLIIDGSLSIDLLKDIILLFSNLVETYLYLDDNSKALEFCKKAIPITKTALNHMIPTEYDVSLIPLFNAFVKAFTANKEYTEALEYAHYICNMTLDFGVADSIETVETYIIMAEIYDLQENHTEALYYYKKALSSQKKAIGKKHIANARL